MARGFLSGLIALVACGVGMVVMAHTHWRISNPVAPTMVANPVLPSVIPWIVGVGESLVAIFVYRLACRARLGWLWIWFGIFFVLALILMIGFAQFMSHIYLLTHLYGFPSSMIMGLWMMLFGSILINRRWPIQ